MPGRKSKHIPKLCHHKATGQGYVRLNGKPHYLGQHDLPETRERYLAVLAEWEAAGRRLTPAPDQITVTELVALFWRHAESYYRKPDGSPTGQLDPVKAAMRALRELYGRTPAAGFGPRKLKAVRQTMIEKGWARTTINDRIATVKLAFKWATAEELIPAGIYQGLQAVSGLKRGRTKARETEPVKPVPEADIEAVKPHLSRHVAAMVELQRLTGMRPGEMVIMRTADLDTAANVWAYRPRDHKTAHHGHGRTVYIGPKGQEVLRPFLKGNLAAYLFDPRKAVADHRAENATARRRPNQQRTKRRTARRLTDRYTPATYRRAIHRACDAAGVPRWSPNRLRHNFATAIRREHGIDLAQTILGHRLGSSITEVYAQADAEKARRVMAEAG